MDDNSSSAGLDNLLSHYENRGLSFDRSHRLQVGHNGSNLWVLIFERWKCARCLNRGCSPGRINNSWKTVETKLRSSSWEKNIEKVILTSCLHAFSRGNGNNIDSDCSARFTYHSDILNVWSPHWSDWIFSGYHYIRWCVRKIDILKWPTWFGRIRAELWSSTIHHSKEPRRCAMNSSTSLCVSAGTRSDRAPVRITWSGDPEIILTYFKLSGGGVWHRENPKRPHCAQFFLWSSSPVPLLSHWASQIQSAEKDEMHSMTTVKHLDLLEHAGIHRSVRATV